MIMKSDSTPLLSVIVPNFNNEQYLGNCLDSILGQTFTDLEIIIADDCSTDNSATIIKCYTGQYPNIRAIYHKKNIGVAENRHSGILQARGRYFTVLDSDDIYYDQLKIETEMELVTRYEKTENRIVCAFSKIAVLDKDLNYIRDQWPESRIKEGDIFNEVISRSAMIPRDYIVATAAYFSVGKYDKTCQPYEDWDLKIRLAKKFHFCYTGIYGTGYRKSGVGLSYISIPNHIKILRKVFNKNVILVEEDKRDSVINTFGLHIQSLQRSYVQSMKKKLPVSWNFISRVISIYLYARIIFVSKWFSLRK
jgi:glycosyltransferase involved in cell wall biosynthesis